MRALKHHLRGSVVALALTGTVAGLSGVVVATTANAQSTVMTATTWVNLRSGPGTSYPVLDVVAPGTSVTATGASSGAWLAVDHDGTSGYISGNYLTASAPPTASAPATNSTAPTPSASAGAATTTAAVNVRSGPGTSYAIVAVAPLGTAVATTGTTSANWSQVIWAGTPRWISSAYLAAPVTAGPVTGAPISDRAAQVVAYAKAHLGSPYLVGSTGPDAFDCSGLVTAAYASAGVQIRHSMATQATTGTYVPLADLRPGDVVIWGNPVSAVSIYVGEGQLVIADGPAYGVRQVSLSSRLSWATFTGGRRYLT